MRRVRIQHLRMVALFGLGLLALLPPAARADSRCEQLINERCDQCHYKTRICQVLGTKSKWGWKRTMKRMVQYGARINKEETDYLTDCLAAAPQGADYVCKYKEQQGAK